LLWKKHRCGFYGSQCSMKRSVFFAAMLGLAAGVSFSLAPARAAVFDWTIGGGDGPDGTLSGSGTYTLSSTPETNSMGTGFLVTAITGTLSSTQFSSAITTMNGGVVGPNGGLDDLIYPSAPGGHLVDDFGLGIALNNGIQSLSAKRTAFQVFTASPAAAPTNLSSATRM
jgi:hypothetical protein